ncbi:MAG TPA: SH3 domain-containing protein, partial [Anaerolineae bacterium]|nr:SH3 domain-containing protein [Anaerolineae bacterium]
VSFISPQAEFTPRNIQSQEERVNLVFAVKIHLDNPDHTLKPGMPADAELLAEVIAAPPSTPTPAATAVPATSTPAVSSPTPTLTAATPLTTPAATPTPPALKQAKVLSYGLNVRRNPGMDQPVLTTLARGDIVPVVAVSPDQTWLQVQLPDDKGVGWIAANTEYVELTPN